MSKVIRTPLVSAVTLRYGLVFLGVGAGLLLIWPGLLNNLLSSDGFMSHGYCYMWMPSLVRLHVLSDSVIGLSYVTISMTLAVLVHRARRDIPFDWMILAFGLFIIACGMTHLMEVWTLWNATYWLSGYIKLITAVVSIATAIALPPLVPKTLTLIRTAKLSEERRVKLENANQELESLYQRVKELDQLKTDFFANISHELRTPLALIQGPTERLLEATNLTAEQQQNLQVVNRNARTLIKHVNDLLDVAKLDAKGMELNYQPLDLAQLIRLTAAHFDALVIERDLRFTISTPETLRLEADSEKLQRVLLNLFSNAFKFTPDHGAINCRLSVSDGKASIEVEDSGPGVPATLRETIFERFRQLTRGAASKFSGTGLGLAIAKEFVELHGGKLSVMDSSLGGARFIIELPLEKQIDEKQISRNETGSHQAFARSSQEITGGSTIVEDYLVPLKTARLTDVQTAQQDDQASVQNDAPLILVVEDNQEMNRFIVETLASDYRVVSAYDGHEGVAKALALRPDLILTDLMMPVMGGDQLVAEIRRQSDFTDLPILVLTAKADEETRSNLLSSGVQDYLMKPFALAELRARVTNLITTSRARSLLQEDLKTHQQDLGKLALEVKQRQRELQEALFVLQISEARFRRVVESDMIGILFMSAEGRISGANNAFLNIIGRTSSEDTASELNLQELTPPEWEELDQIKIKEAEKNGASTHWEKEFLRKDGSRVPVLVGIASIASIDAAKQPLRHETHATECVAFVLDISERKRAERERDQLLLSEQSARHAAEDANRMKDEFLATVSHELRTPLTAMLGWIHMLREGSLDPQTQKRGIESIDRNCKAQAQIVDDLLDVSRIITGNLRLQTNEVEVHKVLEAAVDSLSFAAQAKNIELKLNLPTDDNQHPIRVAGDFERLQQVVWNLLSNAVKFTGAQGGQIKISLRREGEQAVIDVQDTGEGIEPDFLPFVFDRFRQADGTSTRSHGGLGIGLSIVKHLVELHGGTVEADSAGHGHGATFRVRLPVLNKA